LRLGVSFEHDYEFTNRRQRHPRHQAAVRDFGRTRLALVDAGDFGCRHRRVAAVALVEKSRADTARTYLEERFNFRAPERTTEEFLRELGGTDLLVKEQKESLGKFLESCDLVKFAKYEPGEKELREWHSSAVKLVEETEPPEISNLKSQISNPAAPPPAAGPEQIQNPKSKIQNRQ
jgi:hypothetical protein